MCRLMGSWLIGSFGEWDKTDKIDQVPNVSQ